MYVKEQMGYSSIQVTVDTYGHLIPGANISYVDRLDRNPRKKQPAVQQPSATLAQPCEMANTGTPSYVVDLNGGGRQT